MIDWDYVFERINPPALSGNRSSSNLKAFEEAAAFITGGALFSSSPTDSSRYTAFENLKQTMEHLVTQARDEILSDGIVDPAQMVSILTQKGSNASFPSVMNDVAEEAFNKVAGFPSLQRSQEEGCSFGVSLAVSLTVPIVGLGLQLGVAAGCSGGDRKTGIFVRVNSPGSFETDVNLGFALDLGFWRDFAHIAGKTVDFGLNVDLGILAPVITAVSLGLSAGLSQAAMTLNGVRTVPEDSECGKGGWFRSQMRERNCDQIRWGTYKPPPGRGASSFAAVVISFGWGQSFSPLSGELGSSCTTGSWDGGRPHETNCFGFSQYHAETKAWRLKAQTSSSGWAWEVFEIKFWGRKDGQNSDKVMSINDGCTPISSGYYDLPYYDADGPFGGSGFWGGRKGGDLFYIGLKCNDIWNVSKVDLKQSDQHYVSSVSIESGEDGRDWSLEAQVNVLERNSLETIWTK